MSIDIAGVAIKSFGGKWVVRPTLGRCSHRSVVASGLDVRSVGDMSGMIPRFAADAAADEVAAALRTHGVVIVERLADVELCDAMLAELQPWLDETPVGGDDFSGRNTRRTGALLTRCPSSVAMVAHPLILAVVDQTLWAKKTTFQLHLTQSIAIGAGSPAQMVHRDQWCFDFFPFSPDVDLEVSTIWALGDFTEYNGATRVVPDSHRMPHGTRLGFDDTVPAEMERGSVVMYLGSTFHGGGANDSDTTRVGVNVDYVLGWLRQEENQYLSYSLDEVRQMPERVQRLLGYEVGAYALGYIDGGRSPMELLRGTESGARQSFAPG
jgi:ectoine hydroxylase-related dioxygenase (phytanoyl-CoA dioxygenase family)